MFQEEISGIGQVAQKKVGLMKKRPAAYFVLSMLAGMYVGLAILLIFTIGGLLGGSGFAGTKILMGVSFGVSLSLVIMAGSELFTGNTMVMSIGMYLKKITLSDSIKLWVFCWLGNLAGSLVVVLLFLFSGLGEGAVGEFIAKSSVAKISPPAMQLIVRGILCNVLVCLAVWCSYKLKSESGKLIMIFWCLFAFITTGFEHSIANMTLLTIGVLRPMGEVLTWGGYVYNLFFVTLGNMIGGIFLVGLPYAVIGGEKEKK